MVLVVCDDHERVLGRLPPFTVADPWWQEVGSIEERRPGVTVLRVLDGTPERWGHFGGDVTYLAEAADGATLDDLAPWHVELAEDPFRMPWARAGGPRADVAWARSSLEALGLSTGQPVHHRTWNLSAIWAVPANGTTAWLKCVPPFLAHEAVVLHALRNESVPRLLAADVHRLLLASMPGVDGYEADAPDLLALVRQLVDLQVRTATFTQDLLTQGVPDARSEALVTTLEDVIARRAPGDRHLRRLLVQAADRLGEAERCGLPDVLVHGDAHAGNARLGCSPFVWFDWGDSRIGNPLLDLAVLGRVPADVRSLLEHQWLESWSVAVPGSDPQRCWALLRPYAVARMAAVYQTLLDSIEESERRYHADDVVPALEAAAAIVAAEP